MEYFPKSEAYMSGVNEGLLLQKDFSFEPRSRRGSIVDSTRYILSGSVKTSKLSLY